MKFILWTNDNYMIIKSEKNMKSKNAFNVNHKFLIMAINKEWQQLIKIIGQQ